MIHTFYCRTLWGSSSNLFLFRARYLAAARCIRKKTAPPWSNTRRLVGRGLQCGSRPSDPSPAAWTLGFFASARGCKAHKRAASVTCAAEALGGGPGGRVLPTHSALRSKTSSKARLLAAPGSSSNNKATASLPCRSKQPGNGARAISAAATTTCNATARAVVGSPSRCKRNRRFCLPICAPRRRRSCAARLETT